MKEVSQVAGPLVGNDWKESERSSTSMGLKVWLQTITWELAGKAPLHTLKQKCHRWPGNQCFKKSCSLRKADNSPVSSVYRRGNGSPERENQLFFPESTSVISRKFNGANFTTSWLCEIISLQF